jgi:hypothetical protein
MQFTASLSTLDRALYGDLEIFVTAESRYPDVR